jgi:hypothetical protein
MLTIKKIPPGMDAAREELWKILDDDYIRSTMTHVLLYANKQDLPGEVEYH